MIVQNWRRELNRLEVSSSNLFRARFAGGGGGGGIR